MKNEVCSLNEILSIAEKTLELLRHKNDIISGQIDGELSEIQMRAESKMLSDIDDKILSMDSEFINLYEDFFRSNHPELLTEKDKQLIMKLQSIIPLIQELRES